MYATQITNSVFWLFLWDILITINDYKTFVIVLRCLKYFYCWHSTWQQFVNNYNTSETKAQNIKLKTEKISNVLRFSALGAQNFPIALFRFQRNKTYFRHFMILHFLISNIPFILPEKFFIRIFALS